MRSYIRHPSDIPIEIIPLGPVESVLANHPAATSNEDKLKNFSQGGLAFHTQTLLPQGIQVKIRITIVNPVFEAMGFIKWCRHENSGFEVGFEFLDKDDVYKARMVEQICHIEHYKKEILIKEGRVLSGQQAALEWIRKYADEFPEIGREVAQK
jgi:hypothetical protein